MAPRTALSIDAGTGGLAASSSRAAPIDQYEMIAPSVDRNGNVAILTYDALVTHGRSPDGAPVVRRWNSTAVYVRGDGRWKILHSHWSHTKP